MHLHSACSIPMGSETILIPSKALNTASTWDTQRHCNAQWEFHFLRQGECRVDIDREQYHIMPGQALLIRPGIYHQAKTLTPALVRFTLCFNLAEGILSRQLTEKLLHQPVFSPSALLGMYADKILEECAHPGTYSDTYLRSLISCLMVELVRFLGIDCDKTETGRIDPEVQLTQKIDTYFEQHFTDPCGENDLAEQLHVSRRQLVRILKRHYAMSFRQKLIQARMDYAALLLRTTELPVSRIGMDVGYESESAFFKVFRRSFGMTPRQYRTKHK